MARRIWAVTGIAALALALCSLGFLHDPAKAQPETPRPCPEPAREFLTRAGPAAPPAAPPADPLLSLTNSPAYRRAADFSIRVADCSRAEDELESRLQAVRGEVLDMLMEGTEGSRTCTLSLLIPSNRFREFVADLRKMGKVQSERITASRMKPNAPAPSGDEPDPRELSLVALRLADEKVAPAVLESRGLFAASFDRSVSHLLKGAAVLVEGAGYVLPFAAPPLALAGLLALLGRIRRRTRAA